MKKVLVMMIFILSIGAVVFGKFAYDNKLAEIANSAKVDHETMVQEQIQREEEAFAKREDEEQAWFEQLTDGLPTSIKALVEQRFDNDEIHIIAFGSRALVDSQREGIDPWPLLLEKGLNEKYERDLFRVETYEFGQITSLEVLQEEYHLGVARLNPDVVIIEPFLWNDNGIVSTNDTITALSIMVNAFESSHEDVIVMVQPPQPVFGTMYYPQYVEQLRTFVQEETDYMYIDHWNDWPDVEDEALHAYVGEEHRMPTALGHETWKNSIKTFFVNN
ncbi:hypothetical protein QA612_04320 [Evansella sp. AB-P1]|uniref:hypothetical protein n=1 Tax=Evansella sp. AB-P1 TaxID=3037653 RepID=UPI00241FB69B|nr:hypothetical protein [Evansella sp. AB-P1]MDG5786706.1 hypothetical protein [Evansella sp. AB-P1]